LVVVGSVLAYSVYGWLLQNVPVQKVATYAYVNPVIAVFLGALILSEEVTGWTVAGAVVIVGSVAFIVRGQAAEARPRPGGSVAAKCRQPPPHPPSAPDRSAGATRTASSPSGTAAPPTSESSPAGAPTR